MTWWIWVLIGLGCLVLEVVTPGGVVLMFFGAAGLVLGGLVWLGVGGPVWFQVLLFSALSVASLLFLRGPILRRFKAAQGPEESIDSLIGEEAVLLEDLAPGGVGQAELRGSVWRVRGSTEVPLTKGQRCIVDRVRGVDLWVRPA